MVSLQVQTQHFGIRKIPKEAGTSFGNKTAQKLVCIDNKPLDLRITLLTIHWEVIPSIIDVEPITTLELFKMMCTKTAVAEFNDILFKASGKTFEFIQAVFNKKICCTDENFDETKA